MVRGEYSRAIFSKYDSTRVIYFANNFPRATLPRYPSLAPLRAVRLHLSFNYISGFPRRDCSLSSETEAGYVMRAIMARLSCV